jgi:hypothetical protein
MEMKSRKDDLKAATKKQLEELRHARRKDPMHVVNRVLLREGVKAVQIGAKRYPVLPPKPSKRDQRWAEKYCDKSAEYDALTKAIDLLTKQRSHIAAELGEMREFMNAGQQDALVDEMKRRVAEAKAGFDSSVGSIK